MELWQIGLIAAVVGFLAVSASQKRAKQRGLDRLLPLLRERGPLTMPEIMAALNLNGFTAQGKITMELGVLVEGGQIIELPVPDGTPQLQKINVRKYAAA